MDDKTKCQVCDINEAQEGSKFCRSCFSERMSRFNRLHYFELDLKMPAFNSGNTWSDDMGFPWSDKRNNPRRWFDETQKPVTFEVDLNNVDWDAVRRIALKIKSLKDSGDKIAMAGLFDEMLKAFGSELAFNDFGNGVYLPAPPNLVTWTCPNCGTLNEDFDPAIAETCESCPYSYEHYVDAEVDEMRRIRREKRLEALYGEDEED